MKKDKEKNKTTPETPQQEETCQQAEAPAGENEPVVEEQPAQASVDEWREALELAVKQRDDYLDSLRRTQADFQNFKRRNQTARSDGYMDGTCDLASRRFPRWARSSTPRSTTPSCGSRRTTPARCWRSSRRATA